MRVPMGSLLLFRITAAFLSNLMAVPSSRRTSFAVRTTTAYGIIGIKTWIFKGEIMEHDPQARDRKAQELQDGPAPRGAGGRR